MTRIKQGLKSFHTRFFDGKTSVIVDYALIASGMVLSFFSVLQAFQSLSS